MSARSRAGEAVYGEIDAAIDAKRDVLVGLARRIHEYPELRFEEHKAAGWVAETIERETGASVERGLGGMPTALRARAGAPGGPRVAVLAEYDALPEVGHACGHNLIAAAAVGAFVALAPVAGSLGGQVELIGTPAEEGGGGKIKLLAAGVFAGVDAAMMVHPFDRDVVAHTTLAINWLRFRFAGEAAHAALAPWDGKSALTACLQTFALVDAQRVHFRDFVRVHGYVTHGGDAVNVVPERASCEFAVRAADQAELDRVCAVVERCARGAALAGGVGVEVEIEHGYRAMRTSRPLADAFARHALALGRAPRMTDPRAGLASTDMGDVSQALPAVHPWLAICDEGATLCHQRTFAAAAVSDRAFDTLVFAAKAMARTAADVLGDVTLREALRP